MESPIESQATPSLPDLNTQNLPFDDVLRLLDQAAIFNFCAEPAYHRAELMITDDPRDYFGVPGVFGFALACDLHAVRSGIEPTTSAAPRSTYQLGQHAASFSGRLFTTGSEPPWRPGVEPSPVMFDRWRPQFVSLVGAEFALGRDDRVNVYGVGRTYPVNVGGSPRTLVGVVGNVTEGFGTFAGLEGCVHLLGTLDDDLGFRGNVVLRFPDPSGVLQGHATPERWRDPEGDGEFLVMRGEKKDAAVLTTFGAPPNAHQQTLVVPAIIHSVDYPVRLAGLDNLAASIDIGQQVGTLDAHIFTDLTKPLGTAEHPAPFQTRNVYSYTDRHGDVVGSITAEVHYGQSWGLHFPSQPTQAAMRYAGIGPIVDADGVFAGVQGMVAVNSAVGLAPHALALCNVLHVLPEAPVADVGAPLVIAPAAKPSSKTLAGSSPAQSQANSGVPDINAELHPFEDVQEWVDQAAELDMMAVAAAHFQPVRTARRKVGFEGTSTLRELRVETTSSGHSTQSLGGTLGALHQRLLFMPDGHHARPGSRPPSTPFDASRSQEFVLELADLRFGDGEDAFRGFATGKTFPSADGSALLAACIGTLLDGRGVFADRQGTFVINGQLSADGGLTGAVAVRVMDANGRFRAAGVGSPPLAGDDAELVGRYLVVRARKRDRSQSTTPIVSENGQVEGFRLEPDLHQLSVETAVVGGRLRTSSQLGVTLGRLISNVLIDLSALAGPADPNGPPLGFSDYDEFLFEDASGTVIGSFAFDGGAGRRITGQGAPVTGGGESWPLVLAEAPDQPAVRVAGFGPVIGGQGSFRGASGVVAYNGTVALSPHVVSFTFIARLED